MYKRSLKRHITLIFLLMICKRYLSLINATENKGLFINFIFYKRQRSGDINTLLNHQGKVS